MVSSLFRGSAGCISSTVPLPSILKFLGLGFRRLGVFGLRAWVQG